MSKQNIERSSLTNQPRVSSVAFYFSYFLILALSSLGSYYFLANTFGGHSISGISWALILSVLFVVIDTPWILSTKSFDEIIKPDVLVLYTIWLLGVTLQAFTIYSALVIAAQNQLTQVPDFIIVLSLLITLIIWISRFIMGFSAPLVNYRHKNSKKVA